MKNIHILPTEKPKYTTSNLDNEKYKDFSVSQEEPKDVVLGYKTSLVAQMLDKIESKQETLEEVAEKATNIPNLSWENEYAYNKFLEGAKWQQEKTIEEVFEWLTTNNYLTDLKETLINNFKNK